MQVLRRIRHFTLPATRAFHQTAARTPLSISLRPHSSIRFMSAAADNSSSTVAAAAAATAAPAATPVVDVYKGKQRVYTKTGDKGTTSLFNQERRSKADDYFEALGDTDELNALLGVVRAHCHAGEGGAPAPESYVQLEGQMTEIQSRLFDVGAHLATPRTSSNPAQQARTVFSEDHVATLENWIDAMEAHLPPLRHFILPSGGLVATHLQLARAVCRRAERKTVPLVGRGDAEPVVGRYLNRLSDYLFVAARFASLSSNQPEVIWLPVKPPRTPRAPAPSSRSATPEPDSPKSSE